MTTSTVKKMTVEEMVDLLSGTGTDAWNKALANNLQIAANMMTSDAWVKAVDPYLRSCQGEAVLKLLDAKITPEGVNYLRGYAAALRLVLCLPKSVEHQIAQEDQKGKKGVPEGDAGY